MNGPNQACVACRWKWQTETVWNLFARHSLYAWIEVLTCQHRRYTNFTQIQSQSSTSNAIQFFKSQSKKERFWSFLRSWLLQVYMDIFKDLFTRQWARVIIKFVWPCASCDLSGMNWTRSLWPGMVIGLGKYIMLTACHAGIPNLMCEFADIAAQYSAQGITSWQDILSSPSVQPWCNPRNLADFSVAFYEWALAKVNSNRWTYPPQNRVEALFGNMISKSVWWSWQIYDSTLEPIPNWK